MKVTNFLIIFHQKYKQMIENARVSGFYLGKKGLAYISNMRI